MKQLMKDPCSLDTCGHNFCKNCINTSPSYACPQCMLPFWVKNLSINNQLATLLQYIHTLKAQLGTPPEMSCDPIIQQVEDQRLCLKRKKRSSRYLKILKTDLLRHDTSSLVEVDYSKSRTCLKPLSLNKLYLPDPLTKGHIPNPSGLIPRPVVAPVPKPTGSDAVDKRNSLGETPLHSASIKGDVNEVDRLLNEGADPNLKDNAGWTPLHEACNHGRQDIVEKLISGGALINVPGYNNDTPLHDAVRNDHMNVVQTLLNAGAKINVRNCQGLTPIQLTVNDSIIHSLNSSTNNVDTPLPPIVYKRMNIVILGSGLKPYQRAYLSQVSNRLGAEVVTEFTNKVSHVITECDENGCCSRTFKCLLAVTKGCWLVNYNWLVDTANRQEWADENHYMIEGFFYKGRSWKTNSPYKGRINYLNKNPGLFDGFNFYFPDDFFPPLPSKSSLIQLVKLSGGNILSREPKSLTENDIIFTSSYPFHADPDTIFNTCYTLIITSSVISPVYSPYMATLPCSWLLDCISHFKLFDFTK